MVNDLWHRLQRTMSRSLEGLGVEGPLLVLEDRLTAELVLELDRLLPPVNGLLRLDCVCSCMKESWLMMTRTVDGISNASS